MWHLKNIKNGPNNSHLGAPKFVLLHVTQKYYSFLENLYANIECRLDM
jgi:hypothetical protein